MTDTRLLELLKSGEGLTAAVMLLGTEVSLKTLEVAPIGPEVAPIGPEVAPKLSSIKEKIRSLGRADAIENAISVLGFLIEDGGLSISDIESRTHLSNGSVKNAIRFLRVNEIIRREGSNRGGRWVVLA